MQGSSSGAEPRRYYGKYRGLVVENVDPLGIGRVLAQVPDVLGAARSGWAAPCVPVAGVQSGVFVIPAIGSQVWVEFEGGDPAYPIWTGGFWGTVAEVPATASVLPMAWVLETPGGAAATLSDAPPTAAAGGIVLKSSGGAMIVVNDAGIVISNGKGASITLVGPTVDVNAGALTID